MSIQRDKNECHEAPMVVLTPASTRREAEYSLVRRICNDVEGGLEQEISDLAKAQNMTVAGFLQYKFELNAVEKALHLLPDHLQDVVILSKRLNFSAQDITDTLNKAAEEERKEDNISLDRAQWCPIDVSEVERRLCAAEKEIKKYLNLNESLQIDWDTWEIKPSLPMISDDSVRVPSCTAENENALTVGSEHQNVKQRFSSAGLVSRDLQKRPRQFFKKESIYLMVACFSAACIACLVLAALLGHAPSTSHIKPEGMPQSTDSPPSSAVINDAERSPIMMAEFPHAIGSATRTGVSSDNVPRSSSFYPPSLANASHASAAANNEDIHSLVEQAARECGTSLNPTKRVVTANVGVTTKGTFSIKLKPPYTVSPLAQCLQKRLLAKGHANVDIVDGSEIRLWLPDKVPTIIE